jgi:hypothetical protein
LVIAENWTLNDKTNVFLKMFSSHGFCPPGIIGEAESHLVAGFGYKVQSVLCTLVTPLLATKAYEHKYWLQASFSLSEKLKTRCNVVGDRDATPI